MSEIDQQFIEYVVKSLVGKPDAVHIDRRIDEKGVLLELTVDPEDLGRVIGKRGATAQSLRTLLRALGTKNDARYNLKIIDNGDGGQGQGGDGVAASDTPAQDKSAGDDAGGSTKPEPKADKDHDKAEAAETEAPAQEEEAEEAAPETTQPETEAVPEAEATPKADTEDASDRLAQTRKELADLDDLDL